MKLIVKLLTLCGVILCHFIACQAEEHPLNKRTFYDDSRSEKVNTDGLFSTSAWLDDDLTLAWPGRSNKDWFSGFRLIYEPNFGQIFQLGNDRFDASLFQGFSKGGAEFNIWRGVVSFQGSLILPSSLKFDDKSPIVSSGVLLNADKSVNVDFGFAIGGSFFDGLISVGYGAVFYDKRDFNQNHQDYKASMADDGFIFISVQPVSLVRKTFRTGQKIKERLNDAN